MTYDEYIAYHLRGDAGVEERMVSSLALSLGLSAYDSFRFIYYYTMTYHIPSAIEMLCDGNMDKKTLHFRTDRRWVRIGDRFERMVADISYDKFRALLGCKSTREAYNEVSSWYYFARYASFLFLEVYYHVLLGYYKQGF